MPNKSVNKKTSANEHLTKRQAGRINRLNRNISGNINALMDNLNSMTYGIARKDKSDSLIDDFNSLLKTEISDITKTSNGDTTSFITKLLSENNKKSIASMKSLENIFDSNDGQLQSFMMEKYRNRLVKQADLHEIASQLIELQQAVTITRDAIISADIVDGHMSRTLNIKAEDFDDDGGEYIPIIENMEKKFKLQEKIKNFIIPRSLEYGEYFVYCMPYSKIFDDFSKENIAQKGKFSQYAESTKTLYDIIESGKKDTLIQHITESVTSGQMYKTYVSANSSTNVKQEISDEANKYLKNISICNEPIPLVILEEGIDAAREYYTEFVEKTIMEDNNREISFDKIMASVDSGIHLTNQKKKGKNSNNNDFSKFRDCYIKLIDPTHLLPIKLMNETIGYYYIQEEDISPLSGILTSTVYYDKFEGNRNENNILSSIADTIVASFDKKFLEKNIKFKKLIVEALNYFKLHNRKIKFQFIPKEYIIPFKINEDENGDGVSIIEPSLFYAKLYLMLLLFKLMTIIQNSNDTKVNYIKQSGIDLDVVNKIQEIARKKQERQITVNDMFSYTTLVNKIGQGSEMYVPVGKSNERGIETEILSGQDVQLNTELMEMLKKAYISGTGVPDVLMNYLNEADFAKTLELANTRFHQAVVSYQIDYNYQITELYKSIMKYSTTIPETVIDSFTFNFIQPKTPNSNVTNDLLQNHVSLQDFLIALYFGDNIDGPTETAQVQNFKKSLADERLPMLNFEKLDKLYKDACVTGVKDTLNPQESDNEE